MAGGRFLYVLDLTGACTYSVSVSLGFDHSAVTVITQLSSI